MNQELINHIIVVVLTPILIGWLKNKYQSIPPLLLPLCSPLVGIAADWLSKKAGLVAESNWMLGALLGASGVALYNVKDQVFKAKARYNASKKLSVALKRPAKKK